MIDLNALQRLILAGTRLDPDCIPEGDCAVLVPDGMQAVSLEQYNERPKRFRGQYITSNIEDFLGYLSTHATMANFPTLFIGDCESLVEPPRVVAILDFGNSREPGWADHKAIFTPKISDGMCSLYKLCGRIITKLDDITNWIGDWSECLSFFGANGHAITAEAAHGEFSSLTIERLRRTKTTQTEFVRERSALEKLSLNDGLPNCVVAQIPVWDGLKPQDLRLRIAADESPAGVGVTVTLTRSANVKNALDTELRERLTDAKIPCQILSGKFQSSQPG